MEEDVLISSCYQDFLCFTLSGLSLFPTPSMNAYSGRKEGIGEGFNHSVVFINVPKANSHNMQYEEETGFLWEHVSRLVS